MGGDPGFDNRPYDETTTPRISFGRTGLPSRKLYSSPTAKASSSLPAVASGQGFWFMCSSSHKTSPIALSHCGRGCLPFRAVVPAWGVPGHLPLSAAKKPRKIEPQRLWAESAKEGSEPHLKCPTPGCKILTWVPQTLTCKQDPLLVR